MMGRSSRFLDAGYVDPKFKLKLNGKSVFFHAVSSFEDYFEIEHFLFVIRSDFKAREFVTQEIIALGIKDFRIIELNYETDGQAATVQIGTRDYDENLQLIIFNIDTIRYNLKIPSAEDVGDGMLEVFEAEGEGWSFIEPGDNSTVLRTTEKNRISSLCSDGLYIFKHLKDFRRAYQHYWDENLRVKGEIYIAPLYNFLIQSGKIIKYKKIGSAQIDLCGTPVEYELCKEKKLS